MTLINQAKAILFAAANADSADRALELAGFAIQFTHLACSGTWRSVDVGQYVGQQALYYRDCVASNQLLIMFDKAYVTEAQRRTFLESQQPENSQLPAVLVAETLQFSQPLAGF